MFYHYWQYSDKFYSNQKAIIFASIFKEIKRKELAFFLQYSFYKGWISCKETINFGSCFTEYKKQNSCKNLREKMNIKFASYLNSFLYQTISKEVEHTLTSEHFWVQTLAKNWPQKLEFGWYQSNVNREDQCL